MKKPDSGRRYVCTKCGYVYDPAAGDPLSDVPAGTEFADLPPDWVCPICFCSKEVFKEL